MHILSAWLCTGQLFSVSWRAPSFVGIKQFNSDNGIHIHRYCWTALDTSVRYWYLAYLACQDIRIQDYRSCGSICRRMVHAFHRLSCTYMTNHHISLFPWLPFLCLHIDSLLLVLRYSVSRLLIWLYFCTQLAHLDTPVAPQASDHLVLVYPLQDTLVMNWVFLVASSSYVTKLQQYYLYFT